MDVETKEKIHSLVDHGRLSAKFALKSNADYFAKLLKSHGYKVTVFAVDGHSDTVEHFKKLLDKHFQVKADTGHAVVKKMLG